MRSFLLESFKGALSDYEDKGVPGAFKFGSNLDVRRNRDTLYATQALEDDLAVGIFDARVRFVVTSSDGNSYWFLANGKIYKRTSAGVYSLVYTDADGIITGAEEWVNNNGETGIYWATSTKLRRKPIPGASNWSDVDASAGSPAQTYPKTNLTSATWHTMKQVNGALVGVNYNTLFLVGFDESYTNNALQMIPGNIGKTLIEEGINAKIAANRADNSEQCVIYVWDGDALNYNDKMQLPFKDINALINSEISIAQYGTAGQLYFFGDTSKLPVTAFPGGGQVDPAGVDLDSGLALFGVYGNGTGKTGIYTYGRKRKNADFVLNLEYQFDCDEINTVKKIGSVVYFAYKSGSTYGVKKVSTTSKATIAKYQSVDLKAPADLQKIATWNLAVLTMAALPSGCSVEVWRRRDKVETGTVAADVTSDGWYRCNTEDGSSSYSTTGGTEAVFSIGDNAKFLELMIVLNCSSNSSPEIFKAQVFFE